MILKYTNSKGKEFNLIASRLIRVKSANFHSYSWNVEGTTQQFGIEVGRFTKDPYKYKTTLEFRGSYKERTSLINSFHEAMAVDVITKNTGILQWGEYSISCYIISTDTYPDEKSSRTLNDIVIFAPYPFWIKELRHQFLPQTESAEEEGLDFSTDFEFDFANEELGNETWDVDHYTSSHFKMIIYGPCNEPIIYINDYPYQIHTELKENEYLIIDSRKNEVTKYLSDGSTEDLYNSRAFINSVFEKIPSGKLKINWSGGFGFDIILFLERSEPKW